MSAAIPSIYNSCIPRLPIATAGQVHLFERPRNCARQALRGMPQNFSDRLQRVAGHIKMADYLNTWKKGRENFSIDPPNATLFIDWFGPGGGVGPGFHGVGVGRRGVGWR